MAFITLQQMYDAWKRVQDWVSGANTDKPKVTVDNFPETQNVQLTGRNAVKISAINAQEIRGTNIFNTLVDVSNYKDFQVVAISTLDKPVKIRIIPQDITVGTTATYYYIKNNSVKQMNFDNADLVEIIPSTGFAYQYILLNELWDELLSKGVVGLRVSAKCDESPTSGSVTVYLLGVPR